MKKITLALTKGRILKETLPLLAAAGIQPAEDIATSRKLVFASNLPNVEIMVLRGSDVLTYVRHGAADIGVAGKDMLLEDGGDGLYELFDLGIARCRLMTAGLAADKGSKKVDSATPVPRLKVASKYVNTARRYYAARGQQADIIKLYGGMELAPLVGLADQIVDIVDTGSTLAANGLEPRELIADISSRLVVNRASMKVKHLELQPLFEGIDTALRGVG